MSYPKPWVLNGTVINDGIDWYLAKWASALRGWQGLPAARVLAFERYGNWPKIAGVRRPAVRRSLETHFMHQLLADRALARQVYMRAVNYEDEDPYRLLCADFIFPNCSTDKALLALGPWNVRTGDYSTWTILDLIDPDTVEGTLSDTVHFVEGSADGLRALLTEEAITNLVVNPSFETNTTSWSSAWGDTLSQAAPGLIGYQCLKIASDGAVAGTAAFIDVTVSAATTYTASAWIYVPEAFSGGTPELRIYDGAGFGTLLTQTATTQTGTWERIVATGTPATTTLRVVVYSGGTPAAGEAYYVDGVQVEASDYASTYCDGDQGPGYAWTGTPHASTSTRAISSLVLDDHVSLISDKDTLTIRMVVIPQYDYDAQWPNINNNIFDARGSSDSNRIRVSYDASANQWDVTVNGSSILTGAQAFSAGDRIELVVTLDFDSDEYLFYIDSALADSDSSALTAPTGIVAWCIGSSYASTSTGAIAIEQVQVFEKIFTSTEVSRCYTEHLGARWMNILVDEMNPLSVTGKETTLGFIANYEVDEDPRFHTRDGDAAFWGAYESPTNHIAAVTTEDTVRPIYYVTPVTAKSAGLTYRRWVPVIWKLGAVAAFPIKLGTLDTATLTGAGKIQADCDDLRVYDGTGEIDRWIKDPNTASTDIWVVLDFSAAQTATLAAAMGAGDTVTYIQANEDIGAFPPVGRFLVDSEAFTYRGKDEANRIFLNVTRAAKGTAAAAHLINATVTWIEHDIWIYYGDATLSAPTVDDDNEPMFELDTSTNDSWDYNDFGESAHPNRPGTWQHNYDIYVDAGSYGYYYTANHNTDAEPWSEIGVKAIRGDAGGNHIEGRFYLYHPAGILSANFQNAERYWTAVRGLLYIQSSLDGETWVDEYYNDQSGDSASTWTAWSRNETLNADSLYVGLFGRQGNNGCYSYQEAADVTVALDTTYTPDATIGAEQSCYQISCTIANTTLGYSLALAVAVSLGATVEIDTEEKTVLDLAEGENLLGTLSLIGGVRTQWLPMQNGNNVITYTEAGVQRVDLGLVWDRRYIE